MFTSIQTTLLKRKCQIMGYNRRRRIGAQIRKEKGKMKKK
jgi:hypothetical protein